MASKLCPHSLHPTSDARAWVEAGCPLVKLVSDFGPVADYLQINPDLTIVGRGYTPLTLLDQYHTGDPPDVAARKFVDEQRTRYYQPNPLVKIWEGHNEPSFGAPTDAGAIDRMGWYASFEAERVRLMAGLGLRCVVGNFSTGYPEVNERELRMWLAFLPALQAARDHGGFLGLHEYAAPWLWWLAGGFQSSDCDPAHWKFPGGSLGDMGWLTLRYRQVYRYVVLPRGLNLPLVITEGGCDRAGGGCSNMPIGAWRDLVNFWQSWNGSADPIPYWRETPPGQRDPERYYAEQLIWYDHELQKDPYVVGATVFTVGTADPTWEPFNVAGTRVAAHIADYIRRVRGERPPAQPMGDHTMPPSKAGEVWVPPHGTPAPIRADPRSTGTRDVGQMLESSRHSIVDRYEWNAGERVWYLHIDWPAEGWVAARKEQRGASLVWNLDSNFAQGGALPDFERPGTPPAEPPARPPGPPGPPATRPLPPVTLVPRPGGANILANGAFDDGWTTDPKGNQIPNGYQATYTGPGDLLPYPTKMAFDSNQRRSVPVEARAGGWGEYVHKPEESLPTAERKGGRRALVLAGRFVYKDFSDHVSHAFTIRQTLRGTPGALAKAWLPILGESDDRATRPDGKLEDDHWRVRVKLGSAVDERTHAQMVQRRELPQVDRCWNVFTPQAVFPADGVLVLEVTTQQNWPGNTHGVDFFFDNWGVHVEQVAPPPPPPPPPPEPPALKRWSELTEAERAARREEILIAEAIERGLVSGR